uniref:Uncharacterized protein n=1 Tax=Glossina pallidipes TaxID=7398 RepID=A0A1B0AIL4_GLOPL
MNVFESNAYCSSIELLSNWTSTSSSTIDFSRSSPLCRELFLLLLISLLVLGSVSFSLPFNKALRVRLTPSTTTAPISIVATLPVGATMPSTTRGYINGLHLVWRKHYLMLNTVLSSLRWPALALSNRTDLLSLRIQYISP